MRSSRTCPDPSELARGDRTTEIHETLFRPRRTGERISDADVAHLVSVALDHALGALERASPETALASRAEEARSGLHEQFSSLPLVQRTDPTVLAEYRKAVVFQESTRDLALAMINAIERYAAASGRKISHHTM